MHIIFLLFKMSSHHKKQITKTGAKMKINSRKLLEFLTQNCEPKFYKFYQENNGFLKAGNLKIFGNYRKDDGVFSGQIVHFTTLQQSVDRGEKVDVEIVESRTFHKDTNKIETKTRKAKSLDDVIQNFKPLLPTLS